jgi:hypothetical protein
MTATPAMRGSAVNGARQPAFRISRSNQFAETAMKLPKLTLAGVAAGLLSTAAWAQTTAEMDQQRDVNQQERIEQGLQSGELSTREAGHLERDEQHVDRMEANDLRGGKITPAEQARLNAAQNNASRQIYADKHNATTGNPGSLSSQRMQSDVQRNVNQQQRIHNGMDSGALTNKEAGSLERGQAHVARREANAAANGHISGAEQGRIQRSENYQSARTYNEKHNGVTK